LTDGLAGARPTAIRGVLNATANFILSEMGRGMPYADALAEAQRRGLAERDPGADVDGHDSVAKVMVLSALVLGRQLRVEDVARRGISATGDEAVADATRQGLMIRELATLDGSQARVEPVALAADDPLAPIDGTDNAVLCTAEPLGEIMVRGPGAGPELAGQGVLGDLIDVAARLAT
jgi:homoserine dehydrogenase